nr:unnamed protein product [Callosobruchus chinensis]
MSLKDDSKLMLTKCFSATGVSICELIVPRKPLANSGKQLVAEGRDAPDARAIALFQRCNIEEDDLFS